MQDSFWRSFSNKFELISSQCVYCAFEKVGSNYSLLNRHLSPNLKNGFAMLAAVGVAARLPPAAASISLLVSAGGFEPPTTSLRGRCSTIELRARVASNATATLDVAPLEGIEPPSVVPKTTALSIKLQRPLSTTTKRL